MKVASVYPLSREQDINTKDFIWYFLAAFLEVCKQGFNETNYKSPCLAPEFFLVYCSNFALSVMNAGAIMNALELL